MHSAQILSDSFWDVKIEQLNIGIKKKNHSHLKIIPTESHSCLSEKTTKRESFMISKKHIHRNAFRLQSNCVTDHSQNEDDQSNCSSTDQNTEWFLLLLHVLVSCRGNPDQDSLFTSNNSLILRNTHTHTHTSRQATRRMSTPTWTHKQRLYMQTGLYTCVTHTHKHTHTHSGGWCRLKLHMPPSVYQPVNKWAVRSSRAVVAQMAAVVLSWLNNKSGIEMFRPPTLLLNTAGVSVCVCVCVCVSLSCVNHTWINW